MRNYALPQTISQHPWRIAALVGVLANVTFNAINARIGEHLSVADVSDAHPTLFTPAGYAFAIWGLIYGATLLYAVSALLPAQADVRFHDRLAPWLLDQPAQQRLDRLLHDRALPAQSAGRLRNARLLRGHVFHRQ